MTKKKFFGNIKVAVFIGYIILFGLTIFGLIKTYQLLLQFSESTVPTTTESKELKLVSNALVSMYEVESVRNLMLSQAMFNSSLKENLSNSNKKVRNHIDSLYTLSTDSFMRNRLDTVNLLLNKKEKNLEVMYALMDSINKLPYSSVISKTVLKKTEVANLKDLIYDKIISTAKDTTFYIHERRSLKDRLKAVFNSKEDTLKVVSKQDIEVIDANNLEPVNTLTDTIVEYVNSINTERDKRKVAYLIKLSERQMETLYFDECITAQINNILRRISYKERKRLRENLIKRERVLNESYKIVAMIGLLALLVVIFFLIWSLVLINRSIKNRNELEESKLLAEDLLKTRERLLLMISHDVKAPLGSIIGYIELMSDSNLSEKDKKNLDNMRYSSEQILELSNKLMDYHQLEQGKSEIHSVVFNPYHLINDIVQSFIPAIEKKNLYMRLKNNIPESFNGFSDPHIIKQIFNNLISNAIKFTHKGGVEIKAQLNEKENIIDVTIKDTGIGILEEDRTRIFKDFKKSSFQENNKLNDFEGHGLGLAITERLINLLGGKIRFDSLVGVGTVFDLSIPLFPADKDSEKSGNDNTNELKIEIPQIIKGAKVLIVDDDMPMLNVYVSLAKKVGILLETFSNPFEALDNLKEAQYDIIFTDIQMPGMNGFELVRKIKKMNNKNSETPIIALSARFDMKEEDFIEAGFTNFLIKPFSWNEVLVLISKALKSDDEKIDYILSKKENTKFDSNGFNNLILFTLDDKETSLDILNTFKDENETKIQNITQGLFEDNWDVIKSNAHKLLPLMRMIDAFDIVLILESIELGTKEKTHVEKLIELLKQKNDELKQFISENYK